MEPAGRVPSLSSSAESTPRRSTEVRRDAADGTVAQVEQCSGRGERLGSVAGPDSDTGSTYLGEAPRVTAILGISAFYHDSAAALVVDGDIVAAAQEERFTRKKHDDGFPIIAIDYCLPRPATRRPSELDYVGFYDKPLLKFERLLETYLAYAPRGFARSCRPCRCGCTEAATCRARCARGSATQYRKRFVFTEHHESHAASAFFPSPFRGGGHPDDRRRRRVGHRRAAATAAATASSSRTNCASRIRRGCSTRPSPTTAASRSTRASTS